MFPRRLKRHCRSFLSSFHDVFLLLPASTTLVSDGRGKLRQQAVGGVILKHSSDCRQADWLIVTLPAVSKWLIQDTEPLPEDSLPGWGSEPNRIVSGGTVAEPGQRQRLTGRVSVQAGGQTGSEPIPLCTVATLHAKAVVCVCLKSVTAPSISRGELWERGVVNRLLYGHIGQSSFCKELLRERAFWVFFLFFLRRSVCAGTGSQVRELTTYGIK